MTMWLVIAVAAMAIAGIGFAVSSADYTGLLGYFQPPVPGEDDSASASEKDPPRPQLHLIYVRPSLPNDGVSPRRTNGRR